MSTISHPALRATAIAVLLGTSAFAAPSFAADFSIKSGPSSIVVAMDPSDAAAAPDNGSMSNSKMMKGKGHQEMMYSPEKMKEQVEKRIQALHAKLKITPDQEQSWGGVAQAMRDNEEAVSNLVQQRHANAKTMTAVEDLESYQGIAQAHADGLKNVISAFSGLYDGMSDDQKANADKVFGTFEGHPDRNSKKM